MSRYKMIVITIRPEGREGKQEGSNLMVIGKLREPHFNSSQSSRRYGCRCFRMCGKVIRRECENVHAYAAMKHICSYLLLTTALAWYGKRTMFSVSEVNTESAVALYKLFFAGRPASAFQVLAIVVKASSFVRLVLNSVKRRSGNPAIIPRKIDSTIS